MTELRTWNDRVRARARYELTSVTRLFPVLDTHVLGIHGAQVRREWVFPGEGTINHWGKAISVYHQYLASPQDPVSQLDWVYVTGFTPDRPGGGVIYTVCFDSDPLPGHTR